MHEHVIMPFMRLFDPETGHKAAVRLLSAGKVFRPRDRGVDGPELEAEVSGEDGSGSVVENGSGSRGTYDGVTSGGVTSC
jgi:hypothetical protein